MPCYSVAPSFSKTISTPRPGSTKHQTNVVLTPPWSFRINHERKIHLYLYGPLRALFLSRYFVEFFLKDVYPTMLKENFQIYGFQITAKCI